MKRFAIGAIVLVMFMAFLVACGGGGTKSDNASGTPTVTDNASTEEDNSASSGTDNSASGTNTAKPADSDMPSKDISGNVTVWAFTDKAFQEVAAAFMKEYPNIKVQTVIMSFDDVHNKLQTTLAAGTGAPDVAEVEQSQFPRYSTGNVLTDLSQFGANKYKDDTSEYNWTRWSSLDGKQLLGMPWDITPGVTFYRADIMDEMGLPSDPEELGDYIQDPDNFFNLAQTLAANGKYTMEWRDSLIHYYGDMYGYFDKDLNYNRNGPEYVKYLDYAKKANQLKIAPHDGYLSDKGKQRVKKGEQVSFMAGSFAARDLEANFPELKGKWRATRLPLGLNLGLGGSSFVMPAQSKNKEAAWAFILWATRSEEAWKIWTKSEYSIEPSWKSIQQLAWYKNHTNDYLGGQKDYELYDELANQIPVKRITRVDGQIWPLWVDGVLKAMDKNIDSQTALNQIQDTVMKKFSKDIEQMKKEAGIGQ